MNKKIKELFNQISIDNKDASLDEKLYEIYIQIREREDESFEDIRNVILEVLGINEMDFYTEAVDKNLIKYIEKNIFPQYEKNDKAHGIIHIKEVIRRSFSLNDTLKLGLAPNMIYAVAAYHDLGKYIDHNTHEKIAAAFFIKDEHMKKYFSEEEQIIIKEAIEDHRSSFEDNPRSSYGKLISSADRNTRIEIVFIRSFFVGKTRTPDMTVEEFLDYTFNRLSKRYSEENPENMFYEDQTYRIFLQDMRNLLKKEEEFKNRYCEVNHIKSRENIISEEEGEVNYE